MPPILQPSDCINGRVVGHVSITTADEAAAFLAAEVRIISGNLHVGGEVKLVSSRLEGVEEDITVADGASLELPKCTVALASVYVTGNGRLQAAFTETLRLVECSDSAVLELPDCIKVGALHGRSLVLSGQARVCAPKLQSTQGTLVLRDDASLIAPAYGGVRQALKRARP